MAIRVFIVDDHPLVREWLSALLRKQPDLELCGAAQDTADALPAMLVDPPDVAIVDLSLKTGSGIDLIKDLAEQRAVTLGARASHVDHLLAVVQGQGPFRGFGVGWGGGARLGWNFGEDWLGADVDLVAAQMETSSALGSVRAFVHAG